MIALSVSYFLLKRAGASSRPEKSVVENTEDAD
jgi:hypothetical protein